MNKKNVVATIEYSLYGTAAVISAIGWYRLLRDAKNFKNNDGPIE